MDNLTHSLIGLVAGETLARTTRAHPSGLAPDTRRGLFVALAVIGGNLPDLDLLYSFRGWSRSNQSKLTYMLQHRGYTHTVVGCVLLALLLYVAAEAWVRRKRVTLTPRDHWELAGVALFGTLLHLAMDFLNSYGIHPFWPFHNGWVYGDSVFIVEPLYWLAAAPLLFVVRSVTARIFLGLAILAGVALSVSLPFLPMLPRIGFLLLTVVLLAVGSRACARTTAVVSASAMLLVTAIFIAAGQAARGRVAAIAAVELHTDQVIDRVLTPMPMSPLCWDVLLLFSTGDRYRVRHGVLASAPALLSADRCSTISGSRPGTAPMQALASHDPRAVRWLGQFDMSITELADIVATHCDAAALMQFARAPFATELARYRVMGDLRFDREGGGGGMSTIQLGSPTPGTCRQSVPWVPPRIDLLRAAGSLRLQEP
jgi:inner membrane protein